MPTRLYKLSIYGETITLDITETALLIDGRAFTEMMSVELPFFELAQWTSDFVTQELRDHTLMRLL